ncbi:MAG: glycoside hydrolase family 2 TIM barrel-domain containing protein, partial [Bacteroidota bacterium]
MSNSTPSPSLQSRILSLSSLSSLHALLALFALFALLSFQFLPASASARNITTLTYGWKFAKGPVENAYRVKFDDSKWQDVTIPHDWAIAGPFIPDANGNTGKLPWKGEGWYRNKLIIPKGCEGNRVYLVFDGILTSPEIYINGRLAGTWDYGYNSFYLDITDLLLPKGENTVAIHADTRNHDSRWYPGAGIFRKIQMVIVNPVHVAIWGTRIITPIVKPNYADVRIISTLLNRSSVPGDITVEQDIISPKGKVIAKKTASGPTAPGGSNDFETTITLPSPGLWEINNGVMYTVKTIVSMGGEILDSCRTPFGIRTLRFTPDHGLYLNDKRVQLKGVNLHHDLGPLGVAFSTRAMTHRLEQLQAMGCNAIRTSHNTAAPEMLDLCDKMGILVFDEVFDKYDQKADIGPETGFDEFASRNIRNFVIRDRNHPSVFIWSVGNEMGDEQTNTNGGFRQLSTMVNYVRKYDETRPVTMVCDNRNSALTRHFDYYDVHCWNYGRRYDLARQMEPGKPVIISESASTVSTRGFYELPLPGKKTDFGTAMQVSSYDLNAPEWAEIADDDFMWQQDEPYVAGEFVWTGFDYLGEPTPYNSGWTTTHGMAAGDDSHSSYFGILDLCGIPKDRYYLYKSYWMPGVTTVHILPHWNWPGMTGKNVPVFVYTNGDCAELFLNGKSLGTRCKKPGSPKSAERFRLMWDSVAYEPGELRAVASREGEVIGEETMKTAGEPYRLQITPDRTTISADGADLSFILVEAVDKDGIPCPLADNLVEFKLAGPGTIAGVGNGNPRSMEPFQAGNIHLFFGKAMLIVRSERKKGKIE